MKECVVLKWDLMVISVLLLWGCSTKEEKSLMQEYYHKKNYFKKLQKTEKVMLKQNNITKAVLTAQYIPTNSSKLSDKSDETFIIGLYLEDETVDSLRDTFGIRKKGKKKEVLKDIYDSNASHVPQYDEFNMTLPSKYRLTLDGEKAIDIRMLESEDIYLQDIALKSEWTNYALVRFKHSKKNFMTLKFESSMYGVGEATFSKVAKYVYTQKAF